MDGVCSKTGQGDCWRAGNHDHQGYTGFVKADNFAFPEIVKRHFSVSRSEQLWSRNTIKLPNSP
jgi:hypothetical protein